MGAFGAHGLKTVVSIEQLGWYKTGLHYGLWHSIAILIYLNSTRFTPSQRTVGLGLMGVYIFMGTLVVMAITNVRLLGAITPIGGVSLLLFWSSWVRERYKAN